MKRNAESVRLWKQEVLCYVKLLFRYSFAEADKSQGKYSVWQLG
jgi:hypothetical protein